MNMYMIVVDDQVKAGKVRTLKTEVLISDQYWLSGSG